MNFPALIQPKTNDNKKTTATEQKNITIKNKKSKIKNKKLKINFICI